jgi:hypothetical protein
LARSFRRPLPSRGWPRSPVPFRARDGKGGFASVLIGKLGRGQGGSFEKGCDTCTHGHQALVVLGRSRLGPAAQAVRWTYPERR